MPHIDLLITVNRNTCQTFFSLFHFKIWPMCDAYSTKKKKGREQHIHYQKARPQSHKQLSLQYNDLAGTHQIQTRMKDRGKAPPTQLLYVPLHAAEFIKLSMWGEIKAPVLGDFPPASILSEHDCQCLWMLYKCMAEGVFSSGLRSCLLSTHRWKFLLFLSFFFY